jgi:predicted nuclease of predicted toxin-antitoxin system
VKVLFDHNVPHKLRHSLPDHQISTADELGWSELENGELLTMAERAAFDVMVTGDQNLTYQQNWTNRNLALVVLDTNNWNVIKLDTQAVALALGTASRGTIQVVTFNHVR